MRSITWSGPSAPRAPRPHKNALPANAASAPSATARTTSSPERIPLSTITVVRPPTARAMAGSKWRFPALPVTSDLLPREGAGHLASNKRRDLVHIGRVAGVRLEITEARLTVFPQRLEIAGRAQNSAKHAQIRLERRSNAGRHFPWARRAHGHIRSENENVHPSGLGPAQEIEADGMLVAETTIELEPKHIGRDLGCALDRDSPDQTEHVRHARALRGRR